jgi:serine phosphatase RsbU (regulator of sigma subunit)
MVVCKIDRLNSRMLFAGAHNSLYHIRQKKLREYKTDKMPVSVHLVMRPFTGHEINLKSGDTVYLFSDGYADQFGGPRGKKYKYQPFKKLLVSISQKKMQEQELLLEREFEQWKGDLDQIDDVVVIGLKF